MKKKFTDQILDALREGGAQCGTAYAHAQRTGVSKVNMSRWLSGTSPRAADLEPVMDYLGVQLVMPDKKLTAYDLIPKVAAKPGAGASLETDGSVEGLYAFRRDFLGGAHISVTQAVLMDVVGDSMEPLFSEGDTLLVDRSDTDVMDGRIYVVTLGDELRVKRIHKGLSGVILRSENSKYPDIQVSASDLEAFVVHGRVRWVGKAI